MTNQTIACMIPVMATPPLFDCEVFTDTSVKKASYVSPTALTMLMLVRIACINCAGNVERYDHLYRHS